MSEPREIEELEEFLTGFVRPLVAGGQLKVGPPIPPARLEAWEAEIELLGETETSEAIAADRRRVAELLLPRAPAIPLDAEDLRLAVVLHAALALAHPDVEGWTAGRARKRIVAASKRILGTLPAAVDRQRLLARHTLLASLVRVERIDTRITWWTGSATFRGQSPPPRLLRWQAVRRVRQQRVSQSLDEVLTEDGRGLVAAVLRASPLTALLGVAELGELVPLDWRGSEGVLRDQELARAVAYAWLDTVDAKGSDAAALRLTLAARAWSEAIGRVPADVLRTVTAFLIHLGALVAVGEGGMADPDAPSAFLARVLAASPAAPARGESPPEMTPATHQLAAGPPIAAGGGLFFLMPELVAQVSPELAEPPGLADDPRVARRWAVHRTQVRAQGSADESRLAALIQSLRSALA